jgi:hypothetical protein
MITDFAAGGEFAASGWASPGLPPEVAVISFVAPRMKVLTLHVCIGQPGRNPITAIYNRYKMRRGIIDRFRTRA